MTMRANHILMLGMRVFALVLLASGLIGFFGCFACSVSADGIPARVPLPLGDVGAIAVDSRGRIYCSSQGYYRLHQYAPSGRFLRGWASPYKNPRLVIDAGDRLHVLDSDGRQTVYDPSGRTIPDAPTALPEQRAPRVDPLTQRAGSAIYQARTPNLWPRVVKITPDGRTATVVNTPFWLWMLSGPLPGWLRALLGVVILHALDRKSRREGEKQAA